MPNLCWFWSDGLQQHRLLINVAYLSLSPVFSSTRFPSPPCSSYSCCIFRHRDIMAEGVILELKRSLSEYSNVVEEVVRIEKKIFPKHESLSRSFNEELGKKNSGLLYVYANGEVAGYVMYSWPSSLLAVITKLAVKEKYRRHGYGEALLNTAIEKCLTRNIQRITLHVDPSRTPAVNLYKKLGFKIDSLIEKYYAADRDAYRMYLDSDANV